MKAEQHPIVSEADFRQILGIRFFVGSAREAVEIGLQGGLVVVPAAPLLRTMPDDLAICEALINSDLAITDSGLMVLLWNWMAKDHIRRISGLEYIKLLLKQPALRVPHATLWVMPSVAAMESNLKWLRGQGHPTTIDDCYIAPYYNPAAIVDEDLLRIVRERKPAHIIMGVGGGVQEKLGYYLKTNAGYLPGIHCTGAAIGFLSGDQAHIPDWADRYFLGWAFRCMSRPRQFVPRYWKARKLIDLLVRWKERSPAPERELETVNSKG